MGAGKPLAGQRALVTGASSGIGAALARCLAAEGADLVITARRAERLEALAEEVRGAYGVEARVEALDLAAEGAARDLFARTEGAGVAVDVLVNNAGFGAYDDFVEVAWERQASMLQVNLVALTELTHLFARAMVGRGRGRVMNIASIGAYSPCPGFAVYAASKAYVRNFTEALDHELRGKGVGAIVVCPGGTSTEFMARSDQVLKKRGELAMMSAERCAQIAVRKMLRGRRTVITGFLNALGMWMMRLLPRAWQPAITDRAMRAAVDRAPKRPGAS